MLSAEIISKKSYLKTSIPIPEVAAQIGIKASFEKDGSLTKQIYSKYGKPRRAPYIPNDLQPWVQMDPNLRALVRERLEGHLLETRVCLEFKEGMGFATDISAKIAEYGLGIGAGFSALHHSIWQFEAKFWPIEE